MRKGFFQKCASYIFNLLNFRTPESSLRYSFSIQIENFRIFFLPHSTVRIDFSKIWQNAEANSRIKNWPTKSSHIRLRLKFWRLKVSVSLGVGNSGVITTCQWNRHADQSRPIFSENLRTIMPSVLLQYIYINARNK